VSSKEKLRGCKKPVLVLYDALVKYLATLGIKENDIIITCGYRTKSFDIAKGRSGNSLHCSGLAMDVVVNSYHPAKLMSDILKGKVLPLAHGWRDFSYENGTKFNHIGVTTDNKIIEIGIRC